MWDKCKLQYCKDCINTYAGDNVTVPYFSNSVMLYTQLAHSDFVLCGQWNGTKDMSFVEGAYLGFSLLLFLLFHISHDVLIGRKVACIFFRCGSWVA